MGNTRKEVTNILRTIATAAATGKRIINGETSRNGNSYIVGADAQTVSYYELWDVLEYINTITDNYANITQMGNI